MENNEVIKRLKKEILQNIDEKMSSFFDINLISTIIMKIIEHIENTKFAKNFYIDKFGVTTDKNKDNEKLFYIRGSFGHHNNTEACYFAYNSKGEYVGVVKATVLNIIPPTTAEMEYWAVESHMNKGNMTTLARDVIRDVFEKRILDGFKIRENVKESYINSIMVAINKDNYASLAVARKLGFNEKGYLHINDYQNQTKVPIKK